MSEEPTLVNAPIHIPPELFGRLSGPYGSREDRLLKRALKIGLVVFVLSLEAIVIAAFAIVMWHAVNATG